VARPIGPSPAAFAAFRFSDQLVWGWVVGLALCLLGPTPDWTAAGSNLLLVWSVLYAVRGLAVFSAGSRRVPVLVIATLGIIAMFLLPFVLGGLTLLGLADTWLDFRRRLAASTT
jgi:predicted membrane-bound dolichyl-phosphate-mannose-protein mannosyltransferase